MSKEHNYEVEGAVISIPVEEPSVEQQLELYRIYRNTGAEPIPEYEELLKQHPDEAVDVARHEADAS